MGKQFEDPLDKIIQASIGKYDYASNTARNIPVSIGQLVIGMKCALTGKWILPISAPCGK